MSQGGVKATRQEWLETLRRCVLKELNSANFNAVPRSQSNEKLPTFSLFHDVRLYAVPPENEKPVPTGPIGPIDETADQFYEFLKEQHTNSALLKEELEENFTRWKEACHHRAVFARILKSLVKRKFLRYVHRSKRYVPRFRDPVVRRATASALSVQEGIFVGEIKFEPTKPIPPRERLSTKLSIRNDRDVDVSIERTEWFQRSHLFSITD
eukprot:gene35871-45911_t